MLLVSNAVCQVSPPALAMPSPVSARSPALASIDRFSYGNLLKVAGIVANRKLRRNAENTIVFNADGLEHCTA
jgi:hypothetical protein